MNRDPRWQPVLYGRTWRADKWWRVRPADIDVHWLNARVIAATGGGEGLTDAPRALMARTGNVILVGAAGRADLLSDDMNSDGNRPFYCFVGWLSRDPNATVPTLEALQARWVDWARDVYEGWMRVDWKKHPTDLSDAHEPPFGAAPWVGTSAELAALPAAVDAQQRASVPVGGGRPMVVPAEVAGRGWFDLFASPGDFAIAGCFERPMADSARILTHIMTSTYQAGFEDNDTPAGGPGLAEATDAELNGPPPHDAAHPWADGSRPAEAPPPRPPATEQFPGHEPHRRGFLGKASRAIKSLSGAQEVPEEGDASNPRTDRRDSRDPSSARAPAMDLDYWRREHEADPAPGSSSHKKPPRPG